MTAYELEEMPGDFQRAERSFRDFDLSDAATAIATVADVAFVIDADGGIFDVAVNAPELAHAGFGRWIGRALLETVTVESRAKVEALLADKLDGLRRWRQLNHPVSGAADIPVEYCVIHVADDGTRILAGRELTSVAKLQQRLISTQQSMEREYARVRSAEARYRILFQIAAEAVLIVDGTNERIVEANPAAAALFNSQTSRLTSTAIGNLLDAGEAARLQAMFATVRATGGTEEIRARSAGGKMLALSASLFRQGTKAFFLVRMAADDRIAALTEKHASQLAEIIDRLPEGFVVCDEHRKVLSANAAFVEMTQLASIEQLRGESLARWIGRTGIDVDVVFNALAQHNYVRRFATMVRGEHGSNEEVEIAAVAVDAPGSEKCFGLAIRVVRAHSFGVAGSMDRSVGQLTELVGRVPLKELVRETTDLIERLCIEAALRLTGDNRASAAEMLGLSRQSLYVKMRRYDIISPGSELD